MLHPVIYGIYFNVNLPSFCLARFGVLNPANQLKVCLSVDDSSYFFLVEELRECLYDVFVLGKLFGNFDLNGFIDEGLLVVFQVVNSVVGSLSDLSTSS